MRLTETTLNTAGLPPSIAEYVKNAASIIPVAAGNSMVWYIDRGFFLKRVSAGGTLGGEAAMTRHMHGFGFASRLILYEETPEYGYMLTEAAPGMDCTDERLLRQPKRLAEALGLHLRTLHSLPVTGCPRQDRMDELLALANQSILKGECDERRIRYIGLSDPREAARLLRELATLAKRDTLIHGDYCLPNVLLYDDYSLSRFIDWDCGGVGDRHIDLYWGVWSLGYNLKTYAYTNVFLDAYGRDVIDLERMLLCGLIAAFT